MKILEYMRELSCLLLFTLSSCLWVISLNEDKANDAEISPLLELERLIPQHEVQLLNANFSDQLHYDRLAQLQSEVEALAFEADFSDTSEQLLKEYKDTSLGYIQLASMLKTSQRLISENFQFENTRLKELIDDIRLEMFSFVSSPDRTHKAELVDLLDGIDDGDKQQADWQRLQLVKLHSLFVLDNYEPTSTYRQKLIGIPVVEAIVQERVLLQQQANRIAVKRYAGILGVVSSLVLLSIVALKRHQQASRKNSELHDELHEEFAKSVMDMLGPHDEKVRAGLARDRVKDKPMRARRRE